MPTKTKWYSKCIIVIVIRSRIIQNSIWFSDTLLPSKRFFFSLLFECNTLQRFIFLRFRNVHETYTNHIPFRHLSNMRFQSCYLVAKIIHWFTFQLAIWANKFTNQNYLNVLNKKNRIYLQKKRHENVLKCPQQNINCTKCDI